MQQMIATLSPLVFAQGQGFQNRQDILFHRHFAKNRFFLRQVAHAQSRPLEHRESGHVLIAKNDAPTVWADETDDHIECRRFARTVRSQ